MKISKILASLAAAAVAATAMTFSAFAADPVTVTLDENYLGDWKASSGIAREEFDKFDGDVKVVLTVKTENVKDGNSYILKPMDIDKSWDAITASLTTEKGVCKPDGFIQVKADQTEVEFVVPASVKNDLWNTGLAFQCSNITVKSATLSDGSPENDWTYVSDADTPDYCAGRFDPFAAPEPEPEETEADETEATEAEVVEAEDEAVEVVESDDDEDFTVEAEDVVEEAAPVAEPVAAPEAAPEVQPVVTEAVVVETAPAADTPATAPVKTGNAAAVSIAFVMVAAGAAAVVSKRK